MISDIEFFNNCKNKRCLRNTFISKNCEKDFKRKTCYSKYIQQQEKQLLKRQNTYIEKGKEIKDYLDKKERGELIDYPENKEWIEFRGKILERDKTCRIWNILSLAEKSYILKHFNEQLIIIGRGTLDVAHIIPRSEAPQLIFDEENVFLCGRYFHSLLDTYRDLVTQLPIKKSKRIEWINRIMQQNDFWKKDYDYEKFYNNKVRRDT